MKGAAAIVALATSLAWSSGPVLPPGWEIPSELNDSCCQSADFTGSGLLGGAFLLRSKDGNSFALFAHTITSSRKEEWHKLHSGPASDLRKRSMKLIIAGTVLSGTRLPHGGIALCTAGGDCTAFYIPLASGRFSSLHYGVNGDR